MLAIPGEPRSTRRRSYIGHYSRELAAIQKTRVATSNRVKAMRRDRIGEQWMGPQLRILADLKAVESLCMRQLSKYGAEHFMGSWVSDTPGISHAGFARIIGAVGNLDDFPTVSSLWAYVGLDVRNGHAPRHTRGQKANWSNNARWLCLQIGLSMVRLKRGPYRTYYDSKKLEYIANRPDWSAGHAHQAALRYMVKMVLRDMWREWHRRMRDTLSVP